MLKDLYRLTPQEYAEMIDMLSQERSQAELLRWEVELTEARIEALRRSQEDR
jgi:hypothetical protein